MSRRAQGGRNTYEVRVRGLLGPLLLGALPHASFSLEPAHTLVVARAGSRADLLRVLKELTAAGAEVDSIQRIDPT